MGSKLAGEMERAAEDDEQLGRENRRRQDIR